MTTRTLIESELTRRTSAVMRLTKFPIRLMVLAVWALFAVSTSHAADPKTLSVTVRLLSRGKNMISDPPKFGFGANGIGGINLEELVRFNAELRERGTDLILLPVPVKQAFAINRSELEDEKLLFAEPGWGE